MPLLSQRIRRLRQPMSGPPIGPPLASYKASRFKEAKFVATVLMDGMLGTPVPTVRALYRMQMSDTGVGFTKMIDTMRAMSISLVTPWTATPVFLEREERNAKSILGLTGSVNNEDALCQPAASRAYFENALTASPAHIVAGLAEYAGGPDRIRHPRVWAARFMAESQAGCVPCLRDNLLVPYLLPRAKDSFGPHRYLTLGMIEFVSLWSALASRTQCQTPAGVAAILAELDPLLCPKNQLRFFHEDMPAEEGADHA